MASYASNKAWLLNEIQEVIDLGLHVGHVHAEDAWKYFIKDAVAIAVVIGELFIYEYRAVMKVLTICLEALYLSLPYLHCAEATFSTDHDSDFQILKATIPVLLLRLSRDRAAYNFVRFWQKNAHNVRVLLQHNDDFEGLFILREQACANLMHCATKEFQSSFIEPNGSLVEARSITEMMNLLDEDIPFEWVLPQMFDVFQPILSTIPCTPDKHQGWEYLPWQPHNVLPLVLVYMSILRDLRNMSLVRLLSYIPTLPNEIVDTIRFWMPETESIQSMPALRTRASGVYTSEIVIVQKNISNLLLGMKQRVPDYWPILTGSEPGSTETRYRYGPLILHHQRVLTEMPNSLKMCKDILTKIWPGNYSEVEENM